MNRNVQRVKTIDDTQIFPSEISNLIASFLEWYPTSVFEYQDLSALVIDCGSDQCKVGLAGDDMPRDTFCTLVGRLRQPSSEDVKEEKVQKNQQNEIYIGNEAYSKRDILDLNYPIQSGIITNWEDMEKIWSYAFETVLRVSPINRPVLVTETPCNPKSNREKMVEILFENFNIPAVYIGTHPVFSLYASGRGTGVVVDSGDGGFTHSVPIFEGYTLSYAITRLDLSGRQLTDYMMKLLIERGYTLQTKEPLLEPRTIARDIKEKLSYVAQDYEMEMKKDYGLISRDYDEGIKGISSERFQCPEALFKPHLVGIEGGGIHSVIYDSITKCDTTLWKDLFANIVLIGGSTFFEGLAERLYKELSSLVLTYYSIKIVAPFERKYSSWIGGSILASLDVFQYLWITNKEYFNSGPEIVHSKCF